MEVVQKISYRYTCTSRVMKIEERRKTIGGTAGSFDPNTGQQTPGSLTTASDGWWFTTEGPSPISVRCGDERPKFVVGSDVLIILEVV